MYDAFRYIDFYIIVLYYFNYMILSLKNVEKEMKVLYLSEKTHLYLYSSIILHSLSHFRETPSTFLMYKVLRIQYSNFILIICCRQT